MIHLESKSMRACEYPFTWFILYRNVGMRYILKNINNKDVCEDCKRMVIAERLKGMKLEVINGKVK